MSILKREVSSSSSFVSFFIVVTHNFSVNFNIIHFLLWTILTLSSAVVKIAKLPNSSCHFPSNKWVFIQILYPSSVSWKITPQNFFSSNNIYLLKRSVLKWKFLRLSSARIKIHSNSLPRDKSIPLKILRHSSLSWEITPLWILYSYFFNFGLKDLIKIPILRLSSALVKILLYSASHFPNHKSVEC